MCVCMSTKKTHTRHARPAPASARRTLRRKRANITTAAPYARVGGGGGVYRGGGAAHGTCRRHNN